MATVFFVLFLFGLRLVEPNLPRGRSSRRADSGAASTAVACMQSWYLVDTVHVSKKLLKVAAMPNRRQFFAADGCEQVQCAGGRLRADARRCSWSQGNATRVSTLLHPRGSQCSFLCGICGSHATTDAQPVRYAMAMTHECGESYIMLKKHDRASEDSIPFSCGNEPRVYALVTSGTKNHLCCL